MYILNHFNQSKPFTLTWNIYVINANVLIYLKVFSVIIFKRPIQSINENVIIICLHSIL